MGYIENHPLFTRGFTLDIKGLVQWKAILKKQKTDIDMDFEDVLKTIDKRLSHFLNR